MHLIGIGQSLGLFFIVCIASAAMLSLAMVALARMERATVPLRRPSRRAISATPSTLSAERVSSRGSCTYAPRSR